MEEGEIVDCPTCGHLLSRPEVDGIVVCQVCGRHCARKRQKK